MLARADSVLTRGGGADTAVEQVRCAECCKELDVGDGGALPLECPRRCCGEERHVGLVLVVANWVGSFSLVEVFAAAVVCTLQRPLQLRAFVRMPPSA